jgi:hypothetical protein
MIAVQKKKTGNNMYSNNPHTIDDFKTAITEYIRSMGRALPNTVFDNGSACQ